MYTPVHPSAVLLTRPGAAPARGMYTPVHPSAVLLTRPGAAPARSTCPGGGWCEWYLWPVGVGWGGCVEDSGTLLGGIRVSPFGMVFRGGSMKSLNVMLVVR